LRLISVTKPLEITNIPIVFFLDLTKNISLSGTENFSSRTWFEY